MEGRVEGRLAHDTAIERHDGAVDGGGGGEKEVGAEIQSRPGLDSDNSTLTQNRVDVVERAGHRQRGLRQVDDLRQHLLLHGRHPHREQVGGGAHGLNRNAGGVREDGACHVQRRGPLVHLGDECGHRAGIPAGEGFGDVVAGRNEQSLEGLELGQLLAHHDRDDRLLVGQVSLVGRHILVGDDQGRPRGAPGEGFVGKHHHRRHHFGDARRGCGRRVA